ncbi:unnamed protein product, partial [Mesorhabditis belari]|uniref:RRM domain-containing protein n=1 Tax=Mesorhabditis belari TaxID=2138241 RepID=A0AAF3JAM0_9BILA
MYSQLGGADPIVQAAAAALASSAANNEIIGSGSKDTTMTKIFVGGLPYHTSDKTLHDYFEQFGEIEEAVVITDRQTQKSRGYGFVTMKDRPSAERACKDPNPIIDGRKANVNLAYLGAKPRGNIALAALTQPGLAQLTPGLQAAHLQAQLSSLLPGARLGDGLNMAGSVMAQQQAEVVAKMQAAAKEQAGQTGQTQAAGGAMQRERTLYRIAPYAIPIRQQIPQAMFYPQTALLNPALLNAAQLQQAAAAQQGLVDYAALAAAMGQQSAMAGVGSGGTTASGLEQYGYPYNVLQGGFPLQTQLSKDH